MDINPQLGNIIVEELQIDRPSVVPADEVRTAAVSTENQVQSQIQGLSVEETNDPNSIAVNIADQSTPIVVLFGPPACGKTMTLVRLTRYLNHKNYTVSPIPSFRPAHDSHYQYLCDNFDNVIDSNDAAASTSNISFLLVEVRNSRGTRVCQILEAPGEYYYNPGNDREFPPYVAKVIRCPNRKIWCFMVEPEWSQRDYARGYVKKIKSVKNNTKPTDRFVFIYNKVDKSNVVNGLGDINMSQAMKDVGDNYPDIFTSFIKKGIFGNTKNFRFVPFCTGSYSLKNSGGQLFVESDEYYPRKLWEAIDRSIKN